MSPFSHLLHELRMRLNVRQVDLADRMGYEQSYISALEAGLRGPPTPEFVDRLICALEVSPEEAESLKVAASASQRRLEIDANAPQHHYRLLNDLRDKLWALGPRQVELIQNLLDLPIAEPTAPSEPVRRLLRRKQEEVEM